MASLYTLGDILILTNVVTSPWVILNDFGGAVSN